MTSQNDPGSGQPTPAQGEVAAPPAPQGAAASPAVEVSELDYPMPQLAVQETPPGPAAGDATGTPPADQKTSDAAAKASDAALNFEALRKEVADAKAAREAAEARLAEVEPIARKHQEIEPQWKTTVEGYEKDLADARQRIAQAEARIAAGTAQFHALRTGATEVARRHGFEAELPSNDDIRAAGTQALNDLMQNQAYRNMAAMDPQRFASHVAELAAERLAGRTPAAPTQQPAPASAPPSPSVPSFQPPAAPAAPPAAAPDSAAFDAEFKRAIGEHHSLDTPEIRQAAKVMAAAGVPPGTYLLPMVHARNERIAAGKSSASAELPRLPAQGSAPSASVSSQAPPKEPQDLDFWFDRMRERQQGQRAAGGVR